MQKGALAIFQCFKTTKKLPISDGYHEFLESPSDKLQIHTTLGWSLELVHLNGSGPWAIPSTVLVPSLKNTAPIFVKILLIECYTVLVEPSVTSSISSFA